MRLIDADAVISQSHKDLYAYEAGLVKDYLDLFPTIDAVQVCRCKDCYKRDKSWCPMYFARLSVEDDNFCSYGERRGDG